MTSRPARVLFLAHMFPWPLNLGARQRVFHQARGIAAVHDVSLVAYDALPGDGDVADFLAASRCIDASAVPRRPSNSSRPPERPLSRFVRRLGSIDARLRSPLPEFIRDVWSDPLVNALREANARNPVDVVYATRSWMAEHARAAGFPRIVVDVDDLMTELALGGQTAAPWHWRTAIRRFDAAKTRRYERSLARRFTRVVVAKSEDHAFFGSADRERVSIVPNGIVVPPAVTPQRPGSTTLLFVGALGYGPNIDAVRWFARDILPLIWQRRPDARFVVAGFGSAAPVADVLTDPRCSTHESPPDLGPLYDAAALVVTPIRQGGGTRIKILEALGHSRAVVSTQFAAKGLALRAGVDLEFADTPGEIAARCVELLSDESRRIALATAGRETVAARFDWRVIERTLPDLISSAMTAHPTDTPRRA
jgi:polysaccharide biosynthesis protein PslH